MALATGAACLVAWWPTAALAAPPPPERVAAFRQTWEELDRPGPTAPHFVAAEARAAQASSRAAGPTTRSRIEHQLEGYMDDDRVPGGSTDAVADEQLFLLTREDAALDAARSWAWRTYRPSAQGPLLGDHRVRVEAAWRSGPEVLFAAAPLQAEAGIGLARVRMSWGTPLDGWRETIYVEDLRGDCRVGFLIGRSVLAARH